MLKKCMVYTPRKKFLPIPPHDPTFWVTVCKTVCPRLPDRCHVLSLCPECDVGVLWPNGWIKMKLGLEVWPRPWPHCVRRGPSSPQRGTVPNFRPISDGQTDGRIKIPLGTEVGLSPCHIVLHGDPISPPPKKKAQPPNFRPMCVVAKRLHAARYHSGGRSTSTQVTLC